MSFGAASWRTTKRGRATTGRDISLRCPRTQRGAPSNSRLQPGRSRLESDLPKIPDVDPDRDSSSSATGGACSRASTGRRSYFVRPVHLHLYYNVLHAVPAAEEAAAGTAAIGCRPENRRQSSNQRRDSRIDRKREGHNGHVEGGRQRENRSREVGRYECRQRQLSS